MSLLSVKKMHQRVLEMAYRDLGHVIDKINNPEDGWSMRHQQTQRFIQLALQNLERVRFTQIDDRGMPIED